MGTYFMLNSEDSEVQKAIVERFKELIYRFRGHRKAYMGEAILSAPENKKFYNQLVDNMTESMTHIKLTGKLIGDKTQFTLPEMTMLCDLIQHYDAVVRVNDHALGIKNINDLDAIVVNSDEEPVLLKFKQFLREIDPDITITQTPPSPETKFSPK